MCTHVSYPLQFTKQSEHVTSVCVWGGEVLAHPICVCLRHNCKCHPFPTRTAAFHPSPLPTAMDCFIIILPGQLQVGAQCSHMQPLPAPLWRQQGPCDIHGAPYILDAGVQSMFFAFTGTQTRLHFASHCAAACG